MQNFWTHLPGQVPTFIKAHIRVPHHHYHHCHSCHHSGTWGPPGHLPYVSCPNLFISFLRAVTLLAFLAGPDFCEPYSSRTPLHLPRFNIKMRWTVGPTHSGLCPVFSELGTPPGDVQPQPQSTRELGMRPRNWNWRLGKRIGITYGNSGASLICTFPGKYCLRYWWLRQKI